MVAEARERYIAVAFGLPWGWRVRQVTGRLLASGPAPLDCGHRTISATIRDGDVLRAAGRLAVAIGQHKDGI
jgi:uncharacterized protein YciI